MTRPVAAAVELLKGMPVTTERLITTHIPDDHGRCRACTRPGYGSPMARWPCTPYALAALAQAERRHSTPDARHQPPAGVRSALPVSEES